MHNAARSRWIPGRSLALLLFDYKRKGSQTLLVTAGHRKSAVLFFGPLLLCGVVVGSAVGILLCSLLFLRLLGGLMRPALLLLLLLQIHFFGIAI